MLSNVGCIAKVPLGQLPLTARMSLMGATQSAVVDLQESLAFNEPFYVVVVEKENEMDSSFGCLDPKTKNARAHESGEGTKTVRVL